MIFLVTLVSNNNKINGWVLCNLQFSQFLCIGRGSDSFPSVFVGICSCILVILCVEEVFNLDHNLQNCTTIRSCWHRYLSYYGHIILAMQWLDTKDGTHEILDRNFLANGNFWRNIEAFKSLLNFKLRMFQTCWKFIYICKVHHACLWLV